MSSLRGDRGEAFWWHSGCLHSGEGWGEAQRTRGWHRTFFVVCGITSWGGIGVYFSVRVLFAWSAAQVHVEGGKQMSKHLAGQLYELLPHPYGNCTWMQKFETRKSNGRKSRAKVCSATPHHTMHPMHTPGSGGGRVAYTVCGICLSRSCMGLSRSPRSR